MPPKTFKLDAPPPHLQRFEIKGRVERVDLPLYLIWVNGIVFFGGFGGFAFFNTLTQDTQHDDIWVFAGAFIAGLFALIALVFHLKGLIARKKPMLVVDETTVEISADGHVFNFGMLDYILWDQDYRALATPRDQSKKIDTNLIIAYRLGNHFEDGDAKAFAFRASTTVEQMADLQKAYLRLMVIIKSKRKIQRDNKAKAQAFAAGHDIAGLADLLKQLSASTIVTDAGLLERDDPRDGIAFLFPDVPDDKGTRALKLAISALNSKPVNVVTNGIAIFGGVMLTLVNAAFLFALL